MTKLARRGRTALFGIAATLATVAALGSASAQGNFGNFQISPNALQNLQLQQAPQLPATQTVDIQQGNGLRFLDAHEDSSRDFAAVTRSYQNNTSQQWVMTYVTPDTVRFMQVNTGRYLDAHEGNDRQFRVVTRPYQDNSTQLWRLVNYGGGFYSIQQVSSGRYLDNANNPSADFPVYTSGGMYDGEQNSTVWRL